MHEQPRGRLVLLVLVLANLIPLFGVLYLDWDVGSIVVLYWAENLIIGGYIGVVIMTIFAPREITGIAYDSGAVTTSTITVPLVTALGVGLASSIKGRNPLTDGFGLIAFASLTPIIFVMAYGMMV